MGAVGDGAEMAIDVRNEFVHEYFLELCPVKLVHASPFALICHAVSHHDDKWLYLAFCYEIVEYQVGMTLI